MIYYVTKGVVNKNIMFCYMGQGGQKMIEIDVASLDNPNVIFHATTDYLKKKL